MYDDIAKQIKTDAELWQRVCPRSYQVPNDYPSPQAASVLMAMGVALSRTTPKSLDDRLFISSQRSLYYMACLLEKHTMPMFFVSLELLKAVMLSSIDDIAPSDIKWPFPALTFLLPRNTLLSHNGEDCPILMIGKINKGENLRFSLDTGHSHPLDHDGILTIAAAPYTDTFPYYDQTMPIDQPDPWDAVDHAPSFEIPMDGPLKVLSTEANGFIRTFSALAIKLILLMNARPDLIESGCHIKSIKSASHKGRVELWSPNFIGRHYRIRRTERIVEDDDEIGKRSSPRPHWRRGHYRRQHYGPELKSIKTVWIEPVFVGMRDP